MNTLSESLPPSCRRVLRLAERDPRRAVAVARRQLSAAESTGLLRAWCHYTLGRALLAWERLDEAQTALAEAAGLFASQQLKIPALRCSFALLQIEFHRSARPELAPALLAIADQFAQLGAPADAFRARVQLALLYDHAGQAVQATVLLEQLENDQAAAEPLDRARWLVACGAAAGSRGEFATAEARLATAEAELAVLGATIERAKCWFQQGWLALQRDMLGQAREHYLRAEQVFIRLDLPLRRALANRGIGWLATRSGQYDEALRRMLQALNGFTALARTTDIGVCLINLGNIYFYAGMWPIAEAYYHRAEQLFAADQAEGWGLKAQRNRAMALHRQGQLEPAHALLRNVLRRAARAQQHVLAAEALGDFAAVLADMGQYEDALEQYKQARRQCLALGLQFAAADSAMDQGWLMLRHGDVTGAAQQFEFAAPLVGQHPADRWRVQHGQARCAEAHADAPAALAHYQNASRTVAGLRSSLALEAASSTLFAQAAQLHADALRCAAAAGALDTLLALDDSQRALVLQQAIASRPLGSTTDYRDTLAAQQQQIAALYADETLDDETRAQAVDAALETYGELLLQARHHMPAPVPAAPPLPDSGFDLARLRAHLQRAYGHDWTALVYMRSADMLLIATLTPTGIRLDQTPYDKELRDMIDRATLPSFQRYTYNDVPFLRKRTSRPWDLLHRLAERLLPAAVRARLHPDHRLLVVPAEQLHTLPWSALRVGAGWLAEQVIIQLAPALTVWQTLASRRPIATQHALLLGCSQFGTRATALPAVGAELQAVAGAWPGTHTLLADAQATRAALLARSASGDLARDAVVHIATHGHLVPTQGMGAHLKLWDTDIWLAEVAELRLGNALVVLSACEGAGAQPLPGNEVLSLSWAFLAAGAGGVLASLWPIGDAAAPPFMHQFYTALHAYGDAARALAETQRAQIAQFVATRSALAEPWMWSSFVLVGSATAGQ